MDRPYKAGRSTAGYTFGARIEKITDVKPDDVIIGVSHQFEAVNLYRVAGFKTVRGLALDPMAAKCDRAIFYAVYICPDGSVYPNASQEMCGESVTQAVWESDLHGAHEWFKAVASEGT